MGKVYPELDERLRKFIASQSVFFVATAPCLIPAVGTEGAGTGGAGGHVNVSPKGYRDTFAVLGPHRVAYLDLTGSGAETIAHLRQNGQITIMFCSFGHTAKILRLYGTGHIVLLGSAQWEELAVHFPRTAARPHGLHGAGANGAGANGAGANGAGADGTSVSGAGANGVPSLSERGSERAIILVDVERIADSCGYAVPEMELTRERDLLDRWAEKKSPEAHVAYREEKNAVSIDGLPALEPAGADLPGR